MILLVIYAAVIAVLINALVAEWIKLLDKIPEEYEECIGCMCGWCEAEPGDQECRKWRREHGTDREEETRLEDGKLRGVQEKNRKGVPEEKEGKSESTGKVHNLLQGAGRSRENDV